MNQSSPTTKEKDLQEVLQKIRTLAEEATGETPIEPTLISTPPPIAVSVDQAAAMLSISTKSVREYITSGQIPSFRVGRRLLIRAKSLEDFAASMEHSESILREARGP